MWLNAQAISSSEVLCRVARAHSRTRSSSCGKSSSGCGVLSGDRAARSGGSLLQSLLNTSPRRPTTAGSSMMTPSSRRRVERAAVDVHRADQRPLVVHDDSSLACTRRFFCLRTLTPKRRSVRNDAKVSRMSQS